MIQFTIPAEDKKKINQERFRCADPHVCRRLPKKGISFARNSSNKRPVGYIVSRIHTGDISERMEELINVLAFFP